MRAVLACWPRLYGRSFFESRDVRLLQRDRPIRRAVAAQPERSNGMSGTHANSTSFKPGYRSKSWVPIGTERVTSMGYLQRKVTDTGRAADDWVAVHVLNWEAENGPIPAGHLLAFRDGDKTNVDVANLELISRGE